MTPKEVIEKNYECFNTGDDMETFVSLYHDDAAIVGILTHKSESMSTH